MTTVAWFAALVLAHEAGHAVAGVAVGARVEPFAQWPRMGVRLIAPKALSVRALLTVALAGPAASVTLGAMLLLVAVTGETVVVPLGQAGVLSMALGLLSLVPVAGQDGVHVVRALRGNAVPSSRKDGGA